VEYDDVALERKRQEVIGIAIDAIRQAGFPDVEAAERAVAAFARLTPPQKPEFKIQLITMQSLAQEAESVKPGNLFLNWRKLVDVIPDAVIAGAGATAAPTWLLPLIGLYVWRAIWRGASETLSRDEATVIMALWKYRTSENNTIDEDEGFRRTNKVRATQGLQPLDRTIFREAVIKLVRMGCIEMSDGNLWLREWVRVTY
jgi:hypothetical protein